MRTDRNMRALPMNDDDGSNSDSDLSSPPTSTESKEQDPQVYAPMHDPTRSRVHFFDLPAEVRVQILEYLLPYQQRITFEAATRSGKRNCSTQTDPKQPYFKVYGCPKTGSQSQLIVGSKSWRCSGRNKSKGCHQRDPWKRCNQCKKRNKPASKTLLTGLQLQLFLVNKLMCSEARGVLYGSNTYEFTISGKSQASATGSMTSDLIFGPFSALESRLPILRELRSIHLEVKVDDVRTHWLKKRHAARVAHFISVLKEHADDKAQKSLLQEITVHMSHVSEIRDPDPSWGGYGGWGGWNTYSRPKGCNPIAADPETFMFGLEGISELRGIADVSITGVAGWFARCLELCVTGKGGEVERLEWPVVETRKKNPNGLGWKQTLTSTRKWWMPELNWAEFAERNGVELPADAQRFWTEASNDAEEVAEKVAEDVEQEMDDE